MKRILLLVGLIIFAITVQLEGQIARYPISKAPSSSSSSPLLTGLVSYWKLDESSGTLADSHGSNTGTDSGASYGSTGKINTCLNFSDPDYVGCGNPANLQLSTTGSVCAWIYAYERTSNYIVSKADGSTGHNGYFMVLSSGYLYAVLGNASSSAVLGSAALLDLGAWYFCVMTWDATTLSVYVNGTLSSSTAVVTPVSTGYNFQIGADPVESGNSSGFEGLIDEVFVYNICITSTQVNTLFNSGNGVAYPFTGY